MKNKTQLDGMPVWFDGKSINEALFCEEFLQTHKIIFTNGVFFTPEGRVTDELPLRGEIFEELKCCAVSNIPRKISNIVELMKLAALVEDFPPEPDRIHLSNGTLFLDGIFAEGKPKIIRNRFPVAYNPNAPKPVLWLQFLDGLLYPEDIPTLQEYIGYCLIPSNKGQRMMVIKGSGGEGKSQIGAVLGTLFGFNMKDGSIGKISENRFARADLEHILGTPQGGNISPLLANIMLNELDKELEARGLDFVRYADDLIIMVGSKQAAERVMKSVSRYIENKLGLKVNAEKSRVDKPKGIKYLGFGFYYDSFAKGYKARPHTKAVEKFEVQMKKLTCRSWGVSNEYKVEKLNQLIRGWIDYFKIGSMKGLCEKLDSRIRYRLRMCIWKHWKTAKNRARNLMKLDVPRWAAYKIAYCGDRYARLAHNGWVQKAISNKRLADYGLISMTDYYAKRRVTC